MINEEMHMIDATIRDYVCSCIKKKVPDSAKKIRIKIKDSEDKGVLYDLTDEELKTLNIGRIIEENKEIPDDFIVYWIVGLSCILNQRRFTTHVPKITHPDIKAIPGLIAHCEAEADGYVRTGNVPFVLDSTGNAGALAATEFLLLEVNDIPLYQHVREESDIAEQLYDFLGEYGQDVRERFRAALGPLDNSATDSRARQVYFPIGEDNYVILTPLVSMPVMYRLKSIIAENQAYVKNPLHAKGQTSESAFNLEKKNKYLEGGYWDIPDLIDIEFGGAEPQNISLINSKAKVFKLLNCMPHEIRKRRIRIPKHNFFVESINPRNNRYINLFEQLDKLMLCDRNNMKIRNQRDIYLLSLMDEVALDVAAVRYEISQTEQTYNGSLNSAQYFMLYEDDKRYEDTLWLDSLCDDFARWFFDAYKKIVSKPVKLGQDEFIYVRSFAHDNKEVFIQ